MKRIDLNGRWQFRIVLSRGKTVATHVEVQEWMPASVPGTVHTDLLAAGKIPDPFYRMNELDVQWVDTERWVYRKEFDISKDFLDGDAIHLVAEGLDTFAEIILNGKSVAKTSNMFVAHRFAIKSLLKIGNNILEICFDSPTIRIKKLEEQYGALQVSHVPYGVYARVYARKAQYSFGWDWGPKLSTTGIWRSIHLDASCGCRIKSVIARTVKIAKHNADVRVDVELERKGRVPRVLTFELTGKGFAYRKSFAVNGPRKSVTIKIPNPNIWWPNGYGDQPMYQIRISAEAGGIERDTKITAFGIRTVRLLQQKDSEGKSFIMEINGEKIFCKGADWIPSDSFIPRIPESTYERLLTLARDAHMTMIRVWGGGIYEQDTFYELCDRLGLMVWQDFMFACGEYPENRWFLQQVKDEAEKAVTRLRNHPSIVVWCGNNECEWDFCKRNPGKNADDMKGASIFRDLLPSVCQSLDGTRPYWRSSPFGSGFPNDESNGNHHQWSMWGLWKDYKEYESDNARFVTEFGFQAMADAKTYDPVTLPSDRRPQSQVIEHHNKLPEGTQRLFRFQAAHYSVGGDFDDFIYKSQLVQAEALKMAVEHWRRRKFKTAGSLFWQLNDCWPVSSWSVVDSALRPKAAYYYAKKFFAPLLVSFKQMEDGLEVWGTSDVLKPVRCELNVSLWSLNGPGTWTKKISVSLNRNSSKVCLRIKNSSLAGVDTTRNYLLAQLVSGNQILAENRFFFVEPKHLQYEPASISADLEKERDAAYIVTLHSKAFVKNARLEFRSEDPEIEDNYFDIEAGVAKKIRLLSSAPAEMVRENLKVRALFHG